MPGMPPAPLAKAQALPPQPPSSGGAQLPLKVIGAAAFADGASNKKAGAKAPPPAEKEELLLQ